MDTNETNLNSETNLNDETTLNYDKVNEVQMNESDSIKETPQEMDVLPINQPANLYVPEYQSNAASIFTETITASPVTVQKKNINKSSIFLFILSVLLIASLAFGGYQTVSAMKYDKMAATNKEFYEKETLRANELDGNIIRLDDKVVKLEEELSKTDAGKKALEEVNKNLENENGALDQKATTAEEQMKKAQADLAAKQDELVKINSSLAAKKSELDKAQRGIAKFAEVEKLYITFKTKKDEFAGYNYLSIDNINSYLETGNQSYINAANSNLNMAKIAYGEMEELNTQMNAIFDIIKSGSY